MEIRRFIAKLIPEIEKGGDEILARDKIKKSHEITMPYAPRLAP